RIERITLDAEGRWWHEGDPIDNPRIVELFTRSIERTPGGTFVLHVGPFVYPIEVKDTPYLVRRVALLPAEGAARIALSDGSEEPSDLASLRYVPGRGFSCRVKGGTFEARFSRPAYYALADCVQEDAAGELLVLGKTQIRLG